ncbi:hypothetical protein FACHB389_03340 [Nostoc calcicola FACHB-389]|nr:hypothetical protein [Nostoc calcicola FACHB-3891]MDZ8061980.1 hypothetical protein [Nostoc sp. EkiNYC01]OKH41966.1 hypothetical protein FACHB389_03340 [Nostoc calcicola FACHB-389]
MTILFKISLCLSYRIAEIACVRSAIAPLEEKERSSYFLTYTFVIKTVLKMFSEFFELEAFFS